MLSTGVTCTSQLVLLGSGANILTSNLSRSMEAQKMTRRWILPENSSSQLFSTSKRSTSLQRMLTRSRLSSMTPRHLLLVTMRSLARKLRGTFRMWSRQWESTPSWQVSVSKISPDRVSKLRFFLQILPMPTTNLLMNGKSQKKSENLLEKTQKKVS